MEKYVYGDPNAKLCLIQMVDEHDLEGLESEVHEIRKRTEADFCLIALKVSDWNSDLSPWPSPAVFKNEDFGGKAPETLKEVLKLCQDPEKTYIIGGYSIAGLFSLWAVYQTHVFQSAAAASPSVWFPGFIDYMKNHKLMADSVYLSLGDKEEKARNPVLASVGVKIKEAYDLLSQEGIQTILEWNPGNHFRDSDIRTAKAFAWAILT
ncbi:MAG: esterase [Lachnospiraceae bacterium]|nr:esterase [Lachnospiraceae bacterium]